MSYHGKVRWFNDTKGYGFLDVEGHPDTFVHYTEIIGEEADLRTLVEGEEVRFEMAQGERGPKAVNIIRNPGSADGTVSEHQAADRWNNPCSY